MCTKGAGSTAVSQGGSVNVAAWFEMFLPFFAGDGAVELPAVATWEALTVPQSLGLWGMVLGTKFRGKQVTERIKDTERDRTNGRGDTTPAANPT